MGSGLRNSCYSVSTERPSLPAAALPGCSPLSMGGYDFRMAISGSPADLKRDCDAQVFQFSPSPGRPASWRSARRYSASRFVITAAMFTNIHDGRRTLYRANRAQTGRWFGDPHMPTGYATKSSSKSSHRRIII